MISDSFHRAFASTMNDLAPFERRPILAVGFSGGPDSTALLLLALDWARVRSGSVTAFVVDHALRPESALEAGIAAGRARGLGADARILVRQGPAPRSAIQEHARAARYLLLGYACLEAGILHLLIGHHGRDQRETTAMRARRSPMSEGTHGMASVRELDGLRLLRPLLAWEPEALLALLSSIGAVWLTDPANADLRFERAKLRVGVPIAVCAANAVEHPRVESDLEPSAPTGGAIVPWAEGLVVHPLGFARFDLAGTISRAGPEVGRAMLAALLRTLGGMAEHGPDRAAVDRLIARLTGPCDARATLGGCAVTCRNGLVVVVREGGRVKDRAPLATLLGSRWDNRYVLWGRAPLDWAVAALASGWHDLPWTLRARCHRAGIPVGALKTLPAAFVGKVPVACPGLGWTADGGPLPFQARFAPSRNLTLASFAYAGRAGSLPQRTRPHI